MQMKASLEAMDKTDHATWSENISRQLVEEVIPESARTVMVYLAHGMELNLDQAISRLRENHRVALTRKTSSNMIFSFGRDHGYHGRILSQTVIPVQSLAVPTERRVVGWSFTPQDGNSLLSSIAATLWYLYPEGFQDRLDVLRPYVFREV